MAKLSRLSLISALLAALLWGSVASGEPPERSVVINEVAWAGTAAEATDEWIELYNNIDRDIDLSGWRLVSGDGSPDIALTGTIPAHGFFLLERGDDDAVSDMPADQIYQGALKNTGERLRLLDSAGNLIDSANGDGGAWPAGTAAHGSPPYSSMERTDPLSLDLDENWASNDGEKVSGLDAEGNSLNGTPKAINSVLNLPPTAKFTFSPESPRIGEVVTFDGSNSSDPDGEIASFQWDFGDTQTAASKVPTISHQYESPGRYTVRLTVTDDHGVLGSATKEITVRRENVYPVAKFTFSPPDPTTADVIQFTDKSTDPDGKITKWSWDFGDGAGSELRNPSHQYAKAGNYTVQLTVTDNDGASATAAQELRVAGANFPPVADFSFWPVEPTTQEEIQFTDQSSDSDGEVLQWRWDFGDGAVSEVQSPSHRYADDGSYPVKLTVTDDRGATDEATQIVEVANAAPQASFSISPEQAYTGDPISFDASHSSDQDGKIVKYEWDFDGDGEFEEGADSPRITHSFSDDGDYTVRLRVTDDDGEIATASGTVLILNRPPRAAFKIEPQEPSDVDTIKFTDDSQDPDGEIVEWSWDFGDGTTSGEQNPEHRYGDDGAYTVKLTVTDNDGAEASASRKIHVSNVGPIADFSFAPEEPSVNDLVQFTDLSQDPDGYIVHWGWDFGNGTRVTGQPNPEYRYTEPGTYTVKLTVIDEQGALGKTAKEITVAP